MQEAIRLITMKLRVERIEAPGPMNGKALPVVHFTGTSRSMHQAHDPNANSRLYGELPPFLCKRALFFVLIS